MQGSRKVIFTSPRSWRRAADRAAVTMMPGYPLAGRGALAG